MMQRRYELDWLRVIAFALLMFFHTGMLFTSWDWSVKNLETSETFEKVMGFLHNWRMPLLFFISGSAVWFALERYSGWRFLHERQRRLGIPLLFGMLVIVPPETYVSRLYYHQQFDSFLDFYRTLFTSGLYPSGNLSWSYLWYIPYIWTYSVLLLQLFLLLRSRPGRALLDTILGRLKSPWVLPFVFLPSAAAECLLRPFWPTDSMNLVSDWANFAHKLTFFVTGFALASAEGVYDVMATYRRRFLFCGLAALAIQDAGPMGIRLGLPPMAYHALHNFHIWMVLLAVLGYGRRYLQFNHPFLKYANEAVYPFYLLHQMVIVVLGYQLAYVNWNLHVKFLVVFVGTFLIAWAVYHWAIRRWNLLRVLFGLKWISSQENKPAGIGRVAEPALAARLSLLLIAVLLPLASCSRPGGQLVSRVIHAPSLSQNVLGIPDRQPLAIYLPPSYGQSDRRFPVLYFLPNFRSDLWRYTGGPYQGFRLKEAMDRQVAAGALPEMIVVIPNATHFLGSSFYRNSPLTGNWEDYIVRDVVGYVESRFRAIPSPEARGLAGHGVGGMGALELALAHPDVFSCVYAMSPTLFDSNGLADYGIANERQLDQWQEQWKKWEGLTKKERRHAFRDFIRVRLNSPTFEVAMQGFCLAYVAAFSPDLKSPYPHLAFPLAGASNDAKNLFRTKLEEGMGGWSGKITRYLAKEQRLRAIVLEYGRDDQYAGLRRGTDYVAALMRAHGVDVALEIHGGNHDSELRQRLETALFPAMARMLGQ